RYCGVPLSCGVVDCGGWSTVGGGSVATGGAACGIEAGGVACGVAGCAGTSGMVVVSGGVAAGTVLGSDGRVGVLTRASCCTRGADAEGATFAAGASGGGVTSG